MTVVCIIINDIEVREKVVRAIRGSESFRPRNVLTVRVGWNNTTGAYSRDTGEDFQEAD